MVRNGRCTELLNDTTTREDCCNRFGAVATAWSAEEMDPAALFFQRVLGGGVPCVPCKGEIRLYNLQYCYLTSRFK